MSEWIEVIAAQTLANGEHTVIELDDTAVAVFKLADCFYAIEDVCSHDGTEIATGKIQGDEIICPRHGARFCLKTGAVKAAPAYENIHAFPIRVEAGKVFIQDNR